MKVEIEFKTGTNNATQVSQKLSPILDTVKRQGLDAREFRIEMDIGSDGGAAQFPQKISSVFDSMSQQGLNTKEVELEISTTSTSDASQAMQKISTVVDSIKQQGFEVKEVEVDTEKEEECDHFVIISELFRCNILHLG
jgi:hypothetical protein